MDVVYRYQVSDKAEDPDWDGFLLKIPGGHYAQTSVWAKAKALLGWRAIRIIISQRGQIIAGVQVLIRTLPIGGSVGYVPGGPLITQNDPGLTRLVMAQLHQATRDYHIQYLLVQPRCTSEALHHELLGWGYQPSSRKVLATSTALLDLTQDLDHMLSAMRKSTRHNIRLSQRKGVTVREGNESDLQTFYNLAMATSRRHKLAIFSEAYYTGLWHILHPLGHLRLFLAEYAGEAVAASLLISFGDTVTDSIGAWSGDHSKAHPNELLEWTAIAWAKSQGYRYFDFDGITPEVARGELVPDAEREGVTFFKLGFGGETFLYPGAYEYLSNPLARWAYTTLGQRLVSRSSLIKVENFVRGMGSTV